MAISKERLEELIEKEATIWAVYDEDRMERIKLVVKMMGVSVDEYNKIHNCEPMLYSQFYGIVRDICPISWLFETEEDAKWHKEFGCIERTERLELPTWEEFKNKDGIGFITKTGKKVNMFNYDFNNEIYVSDNWYLSETFEYTKEGYTLACRKAKELFLGE